MKIRWALAVLLCLLTVSQAAERQKMSLDVGWLFHEGDITFDVSKSDLNSYYRAKAGHAVGAAATDYDDSDWRKVNLPHDWAVEGPFDPNAIKDQGYRPRGIGWYRRYFKLDPSMRGKSLELQLDGIATNSTIWFNGTPISHNFCGYNSIYLDISPMAKFGDDVNIIAVRDDADAEEGWWYEGAGMYRHTWLMVREPVHLMTDGIYANPVRGEDGKWTVPIEATMESVGTGPVNVTLHSTLLDAAGKEVGHAETDAWVQPFEHPVAKYSITIAKPALWSVDHPNLYTLRTVVKRDANTLDLVDTHCGFRTIRFDAEQGMFLNDQPLKIKGTCNHQDMAGIGVAVPDSIWDFRVRRLKEMGSNAYRCSHNAPAAELLDACDRLGMLVMDENRNFNTGPEYLDVVQWMVRRDRNHPSVMLWSVFNEEPFQGNEIGYEMVRRMGAAVRALDTTRLVTAAQSGAFFSTINASQAADLAGFNYQQTQYDPYHKQNPQRPMSSSEDTSAVQTRGYFGPTDHKKCLIDSYDDQWQPWGNSHHTSWDLIAARPFVAGCFVWTGFDYRGEPQPLVWPSCGSSFGCMDLCGFPKTAYWIHQAQWIADKPMVHLVPDWNDPVATGKGPADKPIHVMAISNLKKVTLSLNGKTIGEKDVDPSHLVSWEVPYEPGTLSATATGDGDKTATDQVETTGKAVALQIIPDRDAMLGNGVDTIPVTVQAVDDHGRVVPEAMTMVQFSINGPATITGLNNGDPTCHEPEKGTQHSLYRGLGLIVVQTKVGTGDATIHAEADGLKAADATVTVRQATPPLAMASSAPTFVVSKWRMSPIATTRPDPNATIGATDANTWSPSTPGSLTAFKNGTFATFRATFKPRAGVQKNGGKLILRDIVGTAQVYLDGKLVAEKTTPDRATIETPVPAGTATRTVSVLIELPKDQQSAGIGGVVTVE